MSDRIFVGFFFGLIALGFYRPFLLVLLYVYVDIVTPQLLTYLVLNSLPVSLIAALLAIGGWILADDKTNIHIVPRQFLIVALIAWCYYTTVYADYPDAAQGKWNWVWKSLAFAAFLPLTLRTRLRIEALLLFVSLSASFIIMIGAIKTLGGGGGYGKLDLVVNNNTGLYEGSTLSAVAVSIIPLVLWLSRFGTVYRSNWVVKLYCYALVFACALIPVGTEARTGLVCIVLIMILGVRDSKHRLRYIALIVAAVMIAVPFLPKTFTARMGTIENHQADGSAGTRVAVWQWTWQYVKTHPTGGGFNSYIGDSLYFEIEGNDPKTGKFSRTVVSERSRAFHSSYFELLGEQGFVGFGLWLLIQIGGIYRMEILRWRYLNALPEEEWIRPLASALQLSHIVYLLGAAFVGIGYQPFIYTLVGLQIALDNYSTRQRAANFYRPLRPQERPRRLARRRWLARYRQR